jgi:hypothetical protein
MRTGHSAPFQSGGPFGPSGHAPRTPKWCGTAAVDDVQLHVKTRKDT